MYLTITYPMSDQPLEWRRIFMFYSIAIMVALISESLGLLLASRLSLIVSCTNVFCYGKGKLNSLYRNF